MADEKNDLTRRDFVALSLAAGLAAAAGEQSSRPLRSKCRT